MTEQIPDRIKRLIWIRHVKGESPTKISKKFGISRTSYYSIISDAESQDPDFPLMRALAVNLKKKRIGRQKVRRIITNFKSLGAVQCCSQNWRTLDGRFIGSVS
jgi:hypothetical protein